MKIVFDIGGTSTRVARRAEDGLGDIRKVPTPQRPEEGIPALAKLIRECAGSEPLEAAAGGFPGVMADGTIHYAPNLPKWKGVDLSAELSNLLEVSVEVMNDADCAALGEASRGAGVGFRVVAYVGVGTGIGCGRIVEGRIDTGAYDLEAGHQIIDARSGEALEELASGRAFEKRFGVHPREAPRRGYVEMTPILSAGLYNMVLHWSPEVLVLGGSMMNEDNGYRLRDIGTALERFPKVYPKLPPLRAALLKDEAGLYGAMMLL